MKRGGGFLTVGLLIAAVVALILTSTVSPFTLTDDSDPPDSAAASDRTEQSRSSYLFVETGKTAAFNSSDDSPDSYRLTVEGVPNQATYFADRPARDAGTIPVTDMFSLVFDPETPDPNAALVGTTPDGDRLTLAVALTDPTYDKAAGTLSFTATLLDGSTPGLSHFEFDTVEATPERLGPVELFIDSGYKNCTVDINNTMSTPLTLSSFTPTEASRWGGGSPPPTVAANTKASVDFKFQSSSNARPAQMVYTAEAPVSNGPPATVTVTMNWDCKDTTLDGNVESHADCQVDINEGPECSAPQPKTRIIFVVEDQLHD